MDPVSEPSGTFLASNDLMEGTAEVQGPNLDSSMAVTSEVAYEGCDLRPGIEFSSYLRMEFSSDILSAVGGSSRDTVKSQDNLEITSTRPDMHFIPEIPFTQRDNSNSLGHVSYTSLSGNPHSEMESDLDAYRSEALYSCPVQLEASEPSTLRELQRQPQDDPVIFESTDDYRKPPASTSQIESLVNVVALAASSSLARTSVDAGMPERVSCGQCEGYPVSSGARIRRYESLPPNSLPFSSQETENEATAFSLSGINGGRDGFSTTIQSARSLTAPASPASTQTNMTTVDEKSFTSSSFSKGSVATFSFEFPPGEASAADGSELYSSSPMRKIPEAVLEETPGSCTTSKDTQEVSDYGLEDPDVGLPAHIPHDGNSLSGDKELANPKAETSELNPAEQVSCGQLAARTECPVAASTSEPPEVSSGEDSYDDHGPGFAQVPVDDYVATSLPSVQVIRVPQLPPRLNRIAPFLVGSEKDMDRLAFPHASQQTLPFHSLADMSEVGRDPGLTGSSSLSAELPTLPRSRSQSGSGETEFFGESVGISQISFSKSDAVSCSEVVSSSTEGLPRKTDTALQTFQPGYLWDTPAYSGRLIPSLSAVASYFHRSRSPFRGRKTARRKRPRDSVIEGRGKISMETHQQELVVELENMIDAQKKAVLWQIDGLQRIVAVQCELTGDNPLSEDLIHELLGEDATEMRSSEQPSAEAQRYMSEVFAIKDMITKTETQEISSTSGATVSQIRDFFIAQKILVRKLMRQVLDETGRIAVRSGTDRSNALPNSNIGAQGHLGIHRLTSIDSMESYLELMRVERTFYGQMQLMQIILRTTAASSVLRRFSERGGLKVLHQWLVEAAAEEQTSVLRQLLKALAHLPITSAAPHQLPALVQSVKNLRLYNNLDVSDQARALLVHWSRMLKQKVEAVKPSGSSGNKLVPVIEKKESLQPDSKAYGLPAQSSSGLTVFTLESSPTSGQPPAPAPLQIQQRWSTTLQPSESAVAAVSVSRKRQVSKSLGDHPKQRRKVQLVAETAGKTLPAIVSKSTAVKSSRPISTDDIYRAKKLQRLLREPRTNSREKPAQDPSIASQTAAKKELSALQQWRVSRDSQDNVPSTDHSPFNDEPFPFAAERSESSYLASRSAKPEGRCDQASAPTLSQHPGIITPTSSPACRCIITPTSSPHRPQLIISRSTSQEHPQMNISPISSPDRQGGVMKPTSPRAPPRSLTTPSTSKDERKRPVASKSSVSSEDLLQITTIVDFGKQDSCGMRCSCTSGQGGLLAISPYCSKIGQLESLNLSESDHLPKADMAGPDISHVLRECNKASGEEGKYAPKEIFADGEHQQQVEQAQTFSVRSRTPPEEVAVPEKVVDDMSGSWIALNEPRMIDYYASLRSTMIRWRIPPAYHVDPQWSVAVGEESKEKGIQSARVKREEEAYYPDSSCIPSDPKDPWEEEPNYDDSLTFEVYLDNSRCKPPSATQIQADYWSSLHTTASGTPPSIITEETPSNMFRSQNVPGCCRDTTRERLGFSGLELLLQQVSAGGGVAHDPALLSLLLQNPELVSQFSSGHSYAQTGVVNQGVLTVSIDVPKEPDNTANFGSGFRIHAGDTCLDRFGASGIEGIGLQSTYAAPPITQLPSAGMGVEGSTLKHLHGKIGDQQNSGFVSQAGSDAQYTALQMPPTVGNKSGLEQARIAPPLPPLPPPQPLPLMIVGCNQVLRPSVQPQTSKVTSWPESHGWDNVRAPLIAAQAGKEQLHMSPQTTMSPKVRSPDYGVIGVPQVEVNPVVCRQEMHILSQGQRSSGCHLVVSHSVNDNAEIQVGQESAVDRNSRWLRPPGPPGRPTLPDAQLRPIAAEYSDLLGTRDAHVTDNVGFIIPNNRGRAGPPTPYKDIYTPSPPPYPASQQRHQTPERFVRPGLTTGVPPFPVGRDLRPYQPKPPLQPWNLGNGSWRPFWRGPQ
ncbi:hypothetical protein R1sor_004176 [Riccia sorocarpa]|uniref:Uncharacterized protein n=1 Tax=Riccia sorocarpa TaxID=122646 RepID=A0ABD3H7M6_9MARC